MLLDTSQTVTMDITSWPQPCDSFGAPAELSDPSWAAPEAGLSRRDASAFLRGMRRYARVDRLDEISADAGSSVASAPPEARYALYYSVYSASTAALAAAEAQGLEPKDAQVRARPPASDSTTLVTGHALHLPLERPFGGLPPLGCAPWLNRCACMLTG
jgi:hypothetical protein